MRYRSIAAICTFSVALAWGCGSADEHPFGGPYGGGSNVAPPTNGTSQTQEGTVPDDGSGNGGDPGTTTTDGGTTTPKKDAGSTTNPTPDSGTTQPTTPTWSSIYTKYLAGGTPGNCKTSCHSQMSSATKAYSWLQTRGYISGASSALIDPSQSCLSWYGGSMPPSGPTSLPAAKTDMAAWVAAGAPNN